MCVGVQTRKEEEFTQDIAARMAEELEAQSAGGEKGREREGAERTERARKNSGEVEDIFRGSSVPKSPFAVEDIFSR